MYDPRIDEPVALTVDLPILELSRGTIGVVRSVWNVPQPAYEVEFSHDMPETGQPCPPSRAILMPAQLQPAG